MVIIGRVMVIIGVMGYVIGSIGPHPGHRDLLSSHSLDGNHFLGYNVQ